MWNAPGGSLRFQAAVCFLSSSPSMFSVIGCATASIPKHASAEAAMEFHNKSIVITGAAGVFGRWITERFARDGARDRQTTHLHSSHQIISSNLFFLTSHTILHTPDLTDEASKAETRCSDRPKPAPA